MAENSQTIRLSINGYGRVGSYAAAKNAKRSRARRFWGICEHCGSLRDPNNPIMGKVGWLRLEGFGKFKTKKEAEAHLLDFASLFDKVSIQNSGYLTVSIERNQPPLNNMEALDE